MDFPVQVSNFIVQSADGKEQISENGASLSGGQIKLIALARILYRDPDVILLDEASANLDIDVVESLKKILKSLKPTKITILVEHNDYFDDLADKIITLT